jgi:hypothetical protein
MAKPKPDRRAIQKRGAAATAPPNSSETERANTSRRERAWVPYCMTMDDIEYHLRISATKFYEWMQKGWMPKPRTEPDADPSVRNHMKRWISHELEKAFDSFPESRGPKNAPTYPITPVTPDEEARCNKWSDQRAA